jgi:hypothetical protein
MKPIKLIVVFFFLSKLSLACQCPVTSLSKQETDKYDLIFRGKISALKMDGSKGEALFMISELYKGNSTEHFKILFDDADACKLELREGDEWIIYTNYTQIDRAKLDFCSRSRKYIKNIKEDFFEVNTGVTYDEEFLYLREKLGLHKFLKENPNRVENRNIIPSRTQFAIVLICSLIGIIFFYWIIRKILK